MTKVQDKEPVIILLDIETSHNIIAAFDLYSYNNYQAILKEGIILSACYKYLGEREVHSLSIMDDLDTFTNDRFNDKCVMVKLREVLEKADVVIAHFGDKFDLPKINARLLANGLKPLPNFITIDTYKIAKSKLKLNSNKLDYLGVYLGLGRKINTNITLWLDCISDDITKATLAMIKMIRYNKQDVVLLEKVFKKLRPFAPAKFNFNHFSTKKCCPCCGSLKIEKRGFTYTRASKNQRYWCRDCGHWSHSVGKEERVR